MSVSNIVNDLYNGLSYQNLDECFNNLKNYEPPEVDWNYTKINRLQNIKNDVKYTTPLEIDWSDLSLGERK
jgi:hypothetical protein